MVNRFHWNIARLSNNCRIVEGFKFNCNNTRDGCTEALVENALGEHESECIYRTVPCLYEEVGGGQCSMLMCHEVIQHYENEHNDEEFLPNINLSKIDTWNMDEIYQWVYILGSPTEAKNYSYTLKLIGAKSEISFKGKVAAIDESFDDLFESGKCFSILHKAFMTHFLDEDNKYEYSLEIHDLKEEVKDEFCESGISDNDEDAKE